MISQILHLSYIRISFHEFPVSFLTSTISSELIHPYFHKDTILPWWLAFTGQENSMQTNSGENPRVQLSYRNCVLQYQPVNEDVPTGAIVSWRFGVTSYFLIGFDTIP